MNKISKYRANSKAEKISLNIKKWIVFIKKGDAIKRMKGEKFSEIIEGMPPLALEAASHADRAKNAPISCCFIVLAALPTLGLLAGVRELWLIILTISLWTLAGIVVIIEVREYLKTQKENPLRKEERSETLIHDFYMGKVSSASVRENLVASMRQTMKTKAESDKGTPFDYNDNSDILVTLNEIENDLQQIKMTNNYDMLHDLTYYCNYLLENYPKMRTHLKSLLETSLNVDSLIKKMRDDSDKDALLLLSILEHPKVIEFAADLMVGLAENARNTIFDSLTYLNKNSNKSKKNAPKSPK